MTTTPYYDNLLANMPEGLERDVFCTVRDYVGKEHAITLPMLSLVIFKDETETHKRMIREAIENLRNQYSIPVCSNSGNAGRYMPANQAELDEFVSEMRARASKLNLTVDNMTRIRWFDRPTHQIPAAFEVKQLSLLDMQVYA